MKTSRQVPFGFALRRLITSSAAIARTLLPAKRKRSRSRGNLPRLRVRLDPKAPKARTIMSLRSRETDFISVGREHTQENRRRQHTGVRGRLLLQLIFLSFGISAQ